MEKTETTVVTDGGTRYGIGIANDKYVLFAAIAPTQCVLGLIWGNRTFELCIGPFVLGFARYAD